MSTENHKSGRQLLRVLFILQGHTFEGLRLKQIAEALECSMPTTFRYLETLAEEGIAERIPGRDDCWRLSPKLIQLAHAHEQEMARLRQRIDEINQRYTRAPR